MLVYMNYWHKTFLCSFHTSR